MTVLALSISACSKSTCGSASGSLATNDQCGVANSDGNSSQGTTPDEGDGGSSPVHGKMVPLPWESATHPERAEWSEFVYDLVGGELATKFLPGTSDMQTFCPKYNTLTNDQRINFWGFLIAGVAKYESSWNPATRYVETSMGTDKITGKQVVSEGLLQLSYQDEQWYTYCDFDWEHDKKLAATDKRKSIFDPDVNLGCGLRILADQIVKQNKISVSSGVYWSTLSPNNKNGRVADIAKMTKAMPGCQ